jgi:ferrous iron transport protein A
MMTIDDLLIGQRAKVARVQRVDHVADDTDLVERLHDIGFTHGETVAVLARAQPGGDPLVVRVGQSRFALRRIEAICVQVVRA